MECQFVRIDVLCSSGHQSLEHAIRQGETVRRVGSGRTSSPRPRLLFKSLKAFEVARGHDGRGGSHDVRATLPDLAGLHGKVRRVLNQNGSRGFCADSALLLRGAVMGLQGA